MKDGRAGLGELKTLWQAAGQRARDLRDAPPRESGQHQSVHNTAQHPRATTNATAATAHEDAQLFRRVMQSVTPLASSSASATPAALPRRAALPAPSAEQLAKRQAALGLNHASHADHPDHLAPLSDHYVPHTLPTEFGLAWHAPDLAADTPRRLQRGQWPVTARLDLHGLRVDAARSALTTFIADCTTHRVRAARVIHGLGHGSANATPVLRAKVPAWLMQHPDVCAFVQAPAAEGGKGALIVLLRAANNPRSNPKGIA